MVRHVKCFTNINYYSQLSLELAFIPSAFQIKKQKWDHEVDFFFQAVNKSQAAIRAQQPGVLTLKSSYSPYFKKENPPKKHVPPLMLKIYGYDKNVR